MDSKLVNAITRFAVGETRPDQTLLLLVSPELSEARRAARQAAQPSLRDRMEEADRAFFERVAQGYRAIADAEPERVKIIDATRPVPAIAEDIWEVVRPLVKP